MFTDWQEALDAEGLPLNPTTTEQEAAAARVTARKARSKEDLVLLLDALGLPGDDDTLTTLLPLLPDHAGETGMTERTLNATEATALSMYYDGTDTAAIADATGLSEDEITALAEANDPPRTPAAADADDTAAVDANEDADSDPGDSVEQLLAWAEAHPTAGIRGMAARVRGDLAELAARRAVDDAQRKAEQRVATLQAELEKTQEELRAVMAGTHPANATATVAPTPIRPGLGSGRTKEELADIRTWARANGYRVADKGMVAKKILDAYDAAQSAPAAKAS
ncbi:histone-like nucleoid-structuring protein Lsr2 [Streptomyces sp. AC550_RSS872]|uniref:Lsr2 family DNA-binding protein n=1 Tax=Streptomyces sp. AC550_RSS872 TaxID=2823689 RepID=UPI001C2667D8|nr:histone-like nucleoid-structuring protein Lsr2 [Streptomyces sp. AC550_RSS872]